MILRVSDIVLTLSFAGSWLWSTQYSLATCRFTMLLWNQWRISAGVHCTPTTLSRQRPTLLLTWSTSTACINDQWDKYIFMKRWNALWECWCAYSYAGPCQHNMTLNCIFLCKLHNCCDKLLWWFRDQITFESYLSFFFVLGALCPPCDLTS